VVLDLAADRWPARVPGPLKLEAVRGTARLAQRYLVISPFGPRRLRIDFTVPDDGYAAEIVVRLHTIGLASGRIVAASLVAAGMSPR